MMITTAQELLVAKGQLEEVDNEIAKLDQTIRDYIDKAAEFNDARRSATRQRTALHKAAAPLREEISRFIQDQRKLENDKLRVAAEAEAAARAAAPPPPTIADLMAKIQELEAKLAG